MPLGLSFFPAIVHHELQARLKGVHSMDILKCKEVQVEEFALVAIFSQKCWEGTEWKKRSMWDEMKDQDGMQK